MSQSHPDKSCPSDTPRTNAVAKWQEHVTVTDYNNMVDFARRLERELRHKAVEAADSAYKTLKASNATARTAGGFIAETPVCGPNNEPASGYCAINGCALMSGEAKLATPPVAGSSAHQWDRDGERCVKCGAKDWMGGPCTAPSAVASSGPKHVCGLHGFNPMIDPPCPACAPSSGVSIGDGWQPFDDYMPQDGCVFIAPEKRHLPIVLNMPDGSWWIRNALEQPSATQSHEGPRPTPTQTEGR